MSLIIKIGADTRAFQSEMKKLTSEINVVGDGLISAGSKMTRNFTVPIAAGFAASVKAGASYERSMSKVKAITGATGKEFEQLGGLAKQMGLDTEFSATDSANALVYMGMAGWKAQDMMEGLRGVMNLATAGATDLATTSDIVTDGLTALGLTAKDTDRFVDILAATVTNSNTNIELMGNTLKYAGPVAGTLGIKMEDLSLAIGLMASASIKGRTAGTSLRGGLVNMIKPTDNMAAAMKKYNIHLKKNKDGTVDLRATIVNLRNQLRPLDKETQAFALSSIFGKEALSGWSAIVNASQSDFDKLAGAIDNSSGAATEMANIMRDNVQGRIDELLSSLEGLGIAIFESIAEPVSQVLKWITKLLNGFSQLSPETRTFIVTALGITALIGPFLKLTGNVVKFLGKLRAIPTAMSKINDNGITRQVRAWLKWQNVTNEERRALERVAKALDQVNRKQAKVSDFQWQGATVNTIGKKVPQAPAKQKGGGGKTQKVTQKQVVTPVVTFSKPKITGKATIRKATEGAVASATKGVGKSAGVRVAQNLGKGIAGTAKGAVSGAMTGAVSGVGYAAVDLLSGDVAGALSSVFAPTIAMGMSSAITSGMSGLGGLVGGLASTIFSPIGLAVAGTAVAVGVGFKKMSEEVVPKVDLLGDTVITNADGTIRSLHKMSEATKTTMTAFNEVDREYRKTFLANTSSTKMTEENLKNLQEANNKFVNYVAEDTKKGYQRRQADLEKFLADTTTIDAEHKAAMLAAGAKNNEQVQGQLETHRKRINEIYANAQRDRRTLNEQELSEIQTRLNHIRELEVQNAIDVKDDRMVIMQRIKDDRARMDAETAAEHVKALNDQRDKEIKVADETYEEKLRIINNMTEDQIKASGKTKEQLIQDARDQRDEQVDSAIQARDEGIYELKQAYPELEETVNTTTGTIETAWGRVKKSISSFFSWYNSITVEPKDIVVTHTTKYKTEGRPYAQTQGGAGRVQQGSSLYPQINKNKATGGMLRSGVTLVGENGPELLERRMNQMVVRPLREGDAKRSAYDGRDALGGGDTFNMTINTTKMTGKEMTDEVNKFQKRRSANNGVKTFRG